MLYVIQHLGLGDHFVTNAIIRHHATLQDWIRIYVRKVNVPTVKAMFEDLKHVEIIALEEHWNPGRFNWNDVKKLKESLGPRAKVLELGFVPVKDGMSFDNTHYFQADIPFDEKWSGFKIPSKYILTNPQRKSYAFVHRDPQRGFDIDFKLLQARNIIEPDFKKYPNALEWIKTIQEASEIHCIDSSFINLIDLLDIPMSHNGNIFYHYYSRNAVIGAQPNLKKPWIRFNTKPSSVIKTTTTNRDVPVFESPYIKRKRPIINLHICDANVGDIYSSPLNYFDFPDMMRLDVRKVNKTSKILDADIIMGGGGLIWQCHGQMDDIGWRHNGKLISWGMGHNSHFKPDEVGKYPDWMHKYDLHGIRDWNSSFPYVPCSSCMHDSLSKSYNIKNEVAIYSHGDSYIDIKGDYPRMSNMNPSLDKIMEFLGSAETILTNTYHGIYWATLLGRRVVIISPFSTRFDNIRYKQPISDEENWQTALNDTLVYDGCLEECRELNVDHYKKVQSILDF